VTKNSAIQISTAYRCPTKCTQYTSSHATVTKPPYRSRHFRKRKQKSRSHRRY